MKLLVLQLVLKNKRNTTEVVEKIAETLDIKIGDNPEFTKYTERVIPMKGKQL